MPIVQLTSILLYCTAGLCVFVIFLNRVLILLRSSRRKGPTILAALIVIVGSFIVMGYFFYRPPWVFAPAALLGLLVLGEVRRGWIRHRCAGTGPVDTVPHKVDITNPVTTTDLAVHTYEVAHPKWRGERLRIVHLTDLHVHPNLPLEYYQEALSIAEQASPDVAVFTGDFVSCAEALGRLEKVLRPISRLESYAVLGNHDYWANPDAIGKVVRGCGLRLLSGESHALAVYDNQIVFTGYDYPWGTRNKSIPPQESGKLHVVLSHTPDNIYRISRSSADFAFCGHYHAGQIRMPFLGPIVVPSVYGRRFDHGHFIVNGTHLFVASGIGAVFPPRRIYCQPDIFIVDIVAENAIYPRASVAKPLTQAQVSPSESSGFHPVR